MERVMVPLEETLAFAKCYCTVSLHVYAAYAATSLPSPHVCLMSKDSRVQGCDNTAISTRDANSPVPDEPELLGSPRSSSSHDAATMGKFSQASSSASSASSVSSLPTVTTMTLGPVAVSGAPVSATAAAPGMINSDAVSDVSPVATSSIAPSVASSQVLSEADRRHHSIGSSNQRGAMRTIRGSAVGAWSVVAQQSGGSGNGNNGPSGTRENGREGNSNSGNSGIGNSNNNNQHNLMDNALHGSSFVMGASTIPMPTHGPHLGSPSGFESLGNTYRSQVMYDFPTPALGFEFERKSYPFSSSNFILSSAGMNNMSISGGRAGGASSVSGAEARHMTSSVCSSPLDAGLSSCPSSTHHDGAVDGDTDSNDSGLTSMLDM